MKKILIVDDEPNIVMTLEYTFKKNNYEVFIARDGQEALDIVENTAPDLIIHTTLFENVIDRIGHRKRALFIWSIIVTESKFMPKDFMRQIAANVTHAHSVVEFSV